MHQKALCAKPTLLVATPKKKQWSLQEVFGRWREENKMRETGGIDANGEEAFWAKG